MEGPDGVNSVTKLMLNAFETYKENPMFTNTFLQKDQP